MYSQRPGQSDKVKNRGKVISQEPISQGMGFFVFADQAITLSFFIWRAQ